MPGSSRLSKVLFTIEREVWESRRAVQAQVNHTNKVFSGVGGDSSVFNAAACWQTAAILK
jgi:hypothetical protein